MTPPLSTRPGHFRNLNQMRSMCENTNSKFTKPQGIFINSLCDHFLLQCLCPQIEKEKSDGRKYLTNTVQMYDVYLELEDIKGSHL